MARCPDCNKFVPMDQGDPEVNDVNVDGNTVTVSVRLVNNCGECGTELTEASVDGEAEFDMPDGWAEESGACPVCNGTRAVEVSSNPDDPEAPKSSQPCTRCDGTGEVEANDESLFEVEEQGAESDVRTEGRGRGTRTFYMARVQTKVTHPDFPDWAADVEVCVEEQASAMESLT